MRYFVTRDEDRHLDKSVRSDLRGSFIRLSDGVTHYELRGPEHGDVVVLVGGLTIPLFYWDRVAAPLQAAGLRTLAYSTYGRGYSDRLNGPYDDALFVRQLGALIGSLGLHGKVHIVGSSMGALIAMGFVERNPEEVATLTVVGPAGLAPMPGILRVLMANDRRAGIVARHLGGPWLHMHEKQNLADRARIAELSAMLRDTERYEGSRHAIFDTIQNFGLFDRAELYGAVGRMLLPRMLLWGREDRVTPVDRLDHAVSLLRPERMEVLDCGHMVPFERPREVAAHIDAFVRSHRGRKAHRD